MSAEVLSDCVLSSAVIERRYRAAGRTDIYYLLQLRRRFFVALKLEHHAADMLVILMPLQKAQTFL